MNHHISRYGAMVAAVALAGCAIKTPYLNIGQRPIADQAMYFPEALPYRMVVVPFVDKRPDLERRGQQPHSMFLLLWNRRVGDYYTNDSLFGGQINMQLATQLAGYLKSANVFTEVHAVSTLPDGVEVFDASALQRIAQTHQADYVLAGELQHFFGSQHQHFSMFMLPLYFVSTFGWQNGKGLPWGQTALQVSLYDARRGDLAWRDLIDASDTLPRDTDSMAEAAVRSFTKAASQLATTLRQLPLDPTQSHASLARESVARAQQAGGAR
ncbi:MAG: hypothetical protein HYZ73_06080 [Elusimicrobia bacterium]|nr:hypothetical protein [Elusimicrobiota bacterium]